MSENEKALTSAAEAADAVEPTVNPDQTAASVSSADPGTAPGNESAPSLTPEEINAANAARSTGKIRDDGRAAPFFSSSDVRAMTRDQVRSNLSRILKSMESGKF